MNKYNFVNPEACSGRISCIAVSPDIDGHGTKAMLLGTAGGGVWRSTDYASAAPHWTPLTDHLDLPPDQAVGAICIGALAVDPNHPSVVYAGTGEANFSTDERPGAGLLKSADGGATWTLLGHAALGGMHLSKVLVDPTDATGNTLYVSTTSGNIGDGTNNWGVEKSTDGGRTWTVVSQYIGFEACITDMEYTLDANGALTLYAAAGNPSGRINNGVYHSTDGGATWDQDAAGTFTSKPYGRISLAADHTPGAHPSVYAAAGPTYGGTITDVYRSTDSGATWTAATSPGAFGGNQSWYDFAIGLSPDGTVYLGGVNSPQSTSKGLLQTMDGGLTWTPIDIGTNNIYPHSDCHAWAFADGAVYQGNDGGLWRFLPQPTQGRSVWEDLNSPGLQTILANSLALSPSDPTIALVASRDNGLGARSASGAWTTPIGGDGSTVRFDPTNGSIAYKAAPVQSLGSTLFFSKSTNAGQTWTGAVSGLSTFNLPDYPVFAIDPANPLRLVFGGSKIYESRDGAATWKSIGAPYTAQVSAIAYAPSDDNVIYVGYNDGPIYRTINDGASWTRAGAGPTGSLVVDPRDANTVYVTMGRSGTSTGGGVWVTTNGGTSWTTLTGDLPNLSVRALAVDVRTPTPTLYIGTSLGVWTSADMGLHWTRYGIGMPDVEVTDLQLDTRLNRLGAATYGRGAFVATVDFPGDVDGNGIVDDSDVALALRIAAGLTPGTPDQVQRGDIFPSTPGLTLEDVLALTRRAAGMGAV